MANARTDGALRPNNTLLQSRADYERHLIRKALEECRFNRSSAARALGVSRVTLHKKIKQYGLSERS
jgi:DNA-binding NtrC family response regulator